MLAFEGNIRSAGSTLIWAAELLGVDTQELARLAATAADSRGVYIVPAFGGLGRPGGTPPPSASSAASPSASLALRWARAALDSIAHQIADVVEAVRMSGAPVDRLLVDGGPTRNDQLMQFEADMVGVPVERTDVAELSAMGVAHLAGVSAGLFTLDGLRRLNRGGQAFRPSRAPEVQQRERDAWARAVARSRGLAIH